MAILKKGFFRYLELVLSIVGVALTFTIPLLIPFHNSWKVTAIVAVTISVIHGGIFWIVRQQKQLVREKTIIDLQRMLKDLVRNQLTVVQMNTSLLTRRPQLADKANNRISDSIVKISLLLETLSDDSLSTWQHMQTSVLPDVISDEIISAET